jgi:hypothetical protein
VYGKPQPDHTKTIIKSDVGVARKSPVAAAAWILTLVISIDQREDPGSKRDNEPSAGENEKLAHCIVDHCTGKNVGAKGMAR